MKKKTYLNMIKSRIPYCLISKWTIISLSLAILLMGALTYIYNQYLIIFATFFVIMTFLNLLQDILDEQAGIN